MQNLYIISKNFYKKASVMTGILTFLGFALFVFNFNQEFINNFRPYYLKAYKEGVAYKMVNFSEDSQDKLALIINSTNKKDSVSNENEPAKSIPVLIYHGIVNKPDGFNILLEDFKNQMFALKKAGWRTISIDDFYKFMKKEKELPEKSFLLTFDDGRKDSYYPVDLILKALNYRATIFVITGQSFKKGSERGNFYLSKNELKRMANSGRWDIQPHTKEGHDFYKISADGKQGHYYSNKLWLKNEQRIETDEEFKKRIAEDFIGAKNDIKQNLGIDSLSFAFPFGDFGRDSINFSEAESTVLNIVKEIYPISFYQVWTGKNFFNFPDKNSFLVKRISAKPDWTAENLLKTLESGRKKVDKI